MEEYKANVRDTESWKWAELIGIGTRKAVFGLSTMVGVEVKIVTIDLKLIPASRAADLVGGPENEVVAIYLTIKGPATGHVMLIYAKEVAYGLVDMLLGAPIGETQELGEMEVSALAEMGNITASSFINSLADNTGLRLMPSVPAVMEDMAGSILDVAVADIMMDRDDVFAMEAIFSVKDQEVCGTLLVLPTKDFMDVMVEHANRMARGTCQQ